MAIKKPRQLKIHSYGTFCTFTAPSESYFAGIRTYGIGHGPFEYEVFEGGSKFLGEGSRNPIRSLPKTGDSTEAVRMMRDIVLERARKVSARDGIELADKLVEHPAISS